jgi:hypothetical protein
MEDTENTELIKAAVCFWNGNKLKLKMENGAVRKQEIITANRRKR